MGQKHFICTHTFCSEQTRHLFLTPPENLNPPSQRLNEKEWSKASKGSYATCLQTWVGNDDFFFCHWIAESEDAILGFLIEGGEDQFFHTMCAEMDYYITPSDGNNDIYANISYVD